MKSYLRGVFSGLMLGAMALSLIRRQTRAPRRFVARMAWRAGKSLGPQAMRLGRVGGRRLIKFARKIG